MTSADPTLIALNSIYVFKAEILQVLRSRVGDEVLDGIALGLKNGTWPTYFSSVEAMQSSLSTIPEWTSADMFTLSLLREHKVDEEAIAATFFPHRLASELSPALVPWNLYNADDPSVQPTALPKQDTYPFEADKVKGMHALHELHLKRKQDLLNFQKEAGYRKSRDKTYIAITDRTVMYLRNALNKVGWPGEWNHVGAKPVDANDMMEAVEAYLPILRAAGYHYQMQPFLNVFFPHVDSAKFRSWSGQRTKEYLRATSEADGKKAVAQLAPKTVKEKPISQPKPKVAKNKTVINIGYWTPEETEKLQTAVRNDLPNNKIYALIPTRTQNAVRHKITDFKATLRPLPTAITPDKANGAREATTTTRATLGSKPKSPVLPQRPVVEPISPIQDFQSHFLKVPEFSLDDYMDVDDSLVPTDDGPCLVPSSPLPDVVLYDNNGRAIPMDPFMGFDSYATFPDDFSDRMDTGYGNISHWAPDLQDGLDFAPTSHHPVIPDGFTTSSELFSDDLGDILNFDDFLETIE
ncbi:hypothetical protein N0V90_007789 [Kalmusia sp. IMI 367209]|nr:hypothetical protein N0V90_007789 [Kalmusia sp. IMI 367209]